MELRASATASRSIAQSGHPLDPLRGEELRRAIAIVRTRPEIGARHRIAICDLWEPDKRVYGAWRDGSGPRPPREAQVVVLDTASERTFEAIVNLDLDQVTSILHVPGVQPNVTADEFEEAGMAARADERVRAALVRRGIEGDAVQRVIVDAWSQGTHEDPAIRTIRGLSWLKADGATAGDNYYARPIGGLVVVVDLNRMAVVRVDDHFVVPLPTGEGGDYRDGGGAPLRADLREISITQPAGVSFTLKGRELRWQRWRMRIGFSFREGLVLHEIGYEDGDEVRSICHRASVAELIIPYGDPNPTVHFKNAFDIGEYGLGPLLNHLELGCDCLGEIRYVDQETVDSRGNVLSMPNAVCIHEEDTGLLWKHFDARSGRTDLARARRLVVSSIATVGNYEYGLFWYFHLDGSIAFEAKLTGVLHTAGLPEGEENPYGLLIAPGVTASNHQHFFCMRLDLDIDGTSNRVVETQAEISPRSPENPDGICFTTRQTVLDRESNAQRDLSPSTARTWKVESLGRTNRTGAPTAYQLVPGGNVSPMHHPDSSVRNRARVLDHPIWITPYRRDERHPAGDYPNQHPGGDGLPRWTAADRPLDGEDVVLWYTFGEHHVPRLEDWPVMPVVQIGFTLRPFGFFDRNPALDVPSPHLGHCAHQKPPANQS